MQFSTKCILLQRLHSNCIPLCRNGIRKRANELVVNQTLFCCVFWLHYHVRSAIVRNFYITAQNSTTTQHLHSFKFTLVNKSHSQHAVGCCCCVGCHFLILYACAFIASFPDQRPWSLHKQNHKLTSRQYAWLSWSLPVVVDKAYEHHVDRHCIERLTYTLKNSILTALY